MGVEQMIEVGMRWTCQVCGQHQDPVEDEEWPYHCSKSMKLRGYWKLGAQEQPFVEEPCQ